MNPNKPHFTSSFGKETLQPQEGTRSPATNSEFAPLNVRSGPNTSGSSSAAKAHGNLRVLGGNNPSNCRIIEGTKSVKLLPPSRVLPPPCRAASSLKVSSISRPISKLEIYKSATPSKLSTHSKIQSEQIDVSRTSNDRAGCSMDFVNDYGGSLANRNMRMNNRVQISHIVGKSQMDPRSRAINDATLWSREHVSPVVRSSMAFPPGMFPEIPKTAYMAQPTHVQPVVNSTSNMPPFFNKIPPYHQITPRGLGRIPDHVNISQVGQVSAWAHNSSESTRRQNVLVSNPNEAGAVLFEMSRASANAANALHSRPISHSPLERELRMNAQIPPLYRTDTVPMSHENMYSQFWSCNNVPGMMNTNDGIPENTSGRTSPLAFESEMYAKAATYSSHIIRNFGTNTGIASGSNIDFTNDRDRNEISPITRVVNNRGSKSASSRGCRTSADRQPEISSHDDRLNQQNTATVLEKRHVVVADLRLDAAPLHGPKTVPSSKLPDHCARMHTVGPVVQRVAKNSRDRASQAKTTQRARHSKKGKKKSTEVRDVGLNRKPISTGTRIVISKISRLYVLGSYELESGYELDTKRFLETESLDDPEGSRRFILKHKSMIVMLMAQIGVLPLELNEALYKLFNSEELPITFVNGAKKRLHTFKGLKSGVYQIEFGSHDDAN